jgi:hypothetical protein
MGVCRGRNRSQDALGVISPGMLVAGVCALGDWLDSLPPRLCIRQIAELDQDLREPVFRVVGAALQAQFPSRASEGKKRSVPRSSVPNSRSP